MNSKQETPAASSSRTNREAATLHIPPETAATGGHGNQPDDIGNALVEPTVGVKLQILKDIDPKGDYTARILAPAVEASLLSDPAAREPSVLCQATPSIPSLKRATDLGIITAQRFSNPGVKDVKIGQELLVVNTSLTTIKPDLIEDSYLNQASGLSGVDAFYEARFLEFGLPQEDNAAKLSLEANKSKGPDHVPSSVSEGRVATLSMDVDKIGVPIFVPSMEMRRSTAGEGAGALANFEQTSPPQKGLAVENVNSDSPSQGSSSSHCST